MQQTNASQIADKLLATRQRIDRAAKESGRRPQAITLIAVSKTHPSESIAAALAAGQVIFGENRVQEAAAKFPALQLQHPALELHLVGPLQTNKTEDAVALFDVIHSLDREKLAKHLARARDKQQREPELFIQVNTGAEDQKAGCAVNEVEKLLTIARRDCGLKVTGLMCIPPLEEPAAPHFALLAKLADANGLGKLSMGMTGDFETAIALGATHVRIGTAIFGNRS